MLCKNCGKPLEQLRGIWVHSGCLDLDDLGIACVGDLLPDAEDDQAEPAS